MATKNMTFRFTDVDLELLEQLATDMGCSKTQVIRSGFAALRRERGDMYAALQAYIDQLKATYGDEAVLVFELDDQFEPFVSIDGQRREDIYTVGQAVEMVERGSGGSEDFVKVLIGDPRSDVRILIALFPMQTGVRVAVPLDELKPDMRPRAVAYFTGE